MDFSQYYDDYSDMGWYEYSSFQLIYGDYSDTYTINGNIYEDYGNTAYASVYIPNNAPTGEYDVRVYDYNSNSYVYLYNGFTVEQEEQAQINYISPNEGQQGESLSVSISGSDGVYFNEDLNPLLMFTQYSETFYAQYADGQGEYITAEVEIPLSASVGQWDVYIYDYVSENYLVLKRIYR